MAEGVEEAGGWEEGRPDHSVFVRIDGPVREYHRRSWSTPARLGPTTSTSETPTERQAVADPRFPDPPVLPLSFLQTDPRLFVFSPFDKAQSFALTFACGSKKPLRLRLRWAEQEDEAGREAVVERTSERAPLAYPGLSAQLDKEVLAEGETGELRVAWSGTEAPPHIVRPVQLDLSFWPDGEAERGAKRGGEWELRGVLEVEVLFRSLAHLLIRPHPVFEPGPAPDHLTLYRPHKNSFAMAHISSESYKSFWVTASAGGKTYTIGWVATGYGHGTQLQVDSSLFSPSEWEAGRAEVEVEWWEAPAGEEALIPQRQRQGFGFVRPELMGEVLPRFRAQVLRSASRPSQSRRLAVLFSQEAALSFGGPGPIPLYQDRPTFVQLRNRSAAPLHWLAVVEDLVAVRPDHGYLWGGRTVKLGLALRRRGRGLRGGVTGLGVFSSQAPRPASLLFPDHPDTVAHFTIPVHHD